MQLSHAVGSQFGVKTQQAQCLLQKETIKMERSMYL